MELCFFCVVLWTEPITGFFCRPNASAQVNMPSKESLFLLPSPYIPEGHVRGLLVSAMNKKSENSKIGGSSFMDPFQSNVNSRWRPAGAAIFGDE